MSKKSKLNRERVSDPYRGEVARATEAIRNAQRAVFTGPTQAQLDAYVRDQAADLERALWLSDAHKREVTKTGDA